MEHHAGDETLLRLFAATVQMHGDRPAVTYGDCTLRYAQLDARSDALARDLCAWGVAPDDRVAVYLPRGVDVLVALLGVLKAGAAYVPVDPRDPRSRRDLMVRHSQARLVLTSPGWEDRLAQVPVPVRAWRSTEPNSAAAPVPAVPVHGSTAACVLFTSGSSGVPKAVVLEHRNLSWFARNPSLPALGPGDRVGQVSSLSFDALHFEVWCSLTQGAEVVVLPAITELLGTGLQRELRRQRITAMLAPTMAVNNVVREDRDAFSSLRVLHTGGDVILPAACRELLSGEFRGHFFNLYGPTEATTACTAYEIVKVSPDESSIPIGRPLDGAAVYLLDERLRLVPSGEVGALHIGGTGVARGYLDAPALTAQRFLPDPFGPPGSRMYATGDLARERPDGLLEFLGRADDQVKVRGYRAEPGEVERTLTAHPDVREAVVTTAGEGDARYLVAFVVPYDTVSPRALREFAAEHLPDYLVPGFFGVLDEIPATEHGKRDWTRLRELLEQHRRRRGTYVAPGTETERYLAGLWEELLAVEPVGADDDFFALGGNSMLAFRAQLRIRRDLGVVLDLPELLDTGRLADLAALIGAGRTESA